jgi:excisionase family DNA binding protein
MKINNDIFFSFPIDLLATKIVEKMQLYYSVQHTEQSQEEGYRTRKETAELLNISLPTLHHYTKKGILTGYRVGVRILYKQSEIESALTQIKYERFKHH